MGVFSNKWKSSKVWRARKRTKIPLKSVYSITHEKRIAFLEDGRMVFLTDKDLKEQEKA